jgi:ATP-binding protein involved in chromosome partitioning
VKRPHIETVLASVPHPRTGQPLSAAGILRALDIDAGKVSVVLEVPASDAGAMHPVCEALEQAITALDGVTSASVLLTAERAPDTPPDLPGRTPPPPDSVRGVAKIIAVGSGKGGVGKSTVSANLALALADTGLRVGLLDADIYGPSQPKLMGSTGRPVAINNMLIPIAAHGIKVMSVGFLMEENRALVWRGPILANALQQMLHEVAWDPLDVLIVDLPPGTGDVQITLTGKTPIDGAIIVTTPQDLALIDARRAIDMLNQTGTPVLGLIENMSTHICTVCGNEDDVFGRGGGEAEANALGIPFMGALPLTRTMRETSDNGTPVVRALPDSPGADRFRRIALALKETLFDHERE